MMLKTEKRAAFSLAMVYAFRMLGLFMILPVFSLYAGDFSGATPMLTGLAIGIYGLTQGLLQLPFGFLSDRFGRKKIIVLGLIIFCIGSIVAANAETISEIILGRAIQGMGAIAAAVMALAADLSREEVRLRIMAAIGMSIGLAFMLSMVIGPVLAAQYGLSMIFWITAVLSIIGIVIIIWITPTPLSQSFHRDAQLSIPAIKDIMSNKELLRLDFGVFVLHLVLSATFVLFPLVLRDVIQIPVLQHWQVYLPVFLLSVVFMLPMIIVAEKYSKLKGMFLMGIALVALAEVGLSQFEEYLHVFAMLVIFFIGFNFLEASLPSLVAKFSPADMKGTAMGLFASAQFFGAFSGGVLGGFLLTQNFGMAFMTLAILLSVWFALAMTMQKPKAVSSRIISLKNLEQNAMKNFLQQAAKLPGVAEVSVYMEDQVAYLKVEKDLFDEELLKPLLV